MSNKINIPNLDDFWFNMCLGQFNNCYFDVFKVSINDNKEIILENILLKKIIYKFKLNIFFFNLINFFQDKKGNIGIYVCDTDTSVQGGWNEEIDGIPKHSHYIFTKSGFEKINVSEISFTFNWK